MDIFYSEFEKSKCLHYYARGKLEEVLSEFHKKLMQEKPSDCLWGFFCLRPDGVQINLGVGEKPCAEHTLNIYPTKEGALANLTECLSEGNEPDVESEELKIEDMELIELLKLIKQ